MADRTMKERKEIDVTRRRYRLGHAVIEIQMPKGMPHPENLEKFAYEQEESDQIDRIYQFNDTDCLKDIEQMLREEFAQASEIRRDTMCVLSTAEKECRILNFQGAQKPYGISVEESDTFSRVWVEREVAPMLKYETIFLSLLSLEKLI